MTAHSPLQSCVASWLTQSLRVSSLLLVSRLSAREVSDGTAALSVCADAGVHLAGGAQRARRLRPATRSARGDVLRTRAAALHRPRAWHRAHRDRQHSGDRHARRPCGPHPALDLAGAAEPAMKFLHWCVGAMQILTGFMLA